MSARARCRNIGSDGKKGYNSFGCRACGKEKETIGHLINCSIIEKEPRKEITEKKNGKSGEVI